LSPPILDFTICPFWITLANGESKFEGILMTPTALIFFVLFGLTIFVTYMAVRRSWAPTRIVTIAGAILSIITMVMFSLGQGNTIAQALVVGFLVGSIFAAAAVSIASFFRSSEARANAEPRQ
jgi:nitrate/nitrite transporter NarK